MPLGQQRDPPPAYSSAKMELLIDDIGRSHQESQAKCLEIFRVSIQRSPLAPPQNFEIVSVHWALDVAEISLITLDLSQSSTRR